MHDILDVYVFPKKCYSNLYEASIWNYIYAIMLFLLTNVDTILVIHIYVFSFDLKCKIYIYIFFVKFSLYTM